MENGKPSSWERVDDGAMEKRSMGNNQGGMVGVNTEVNMGRLPNKLVGNLAIIRGNFKSTSYKKLY